MVYMRQKLLRIWRFVRWPALVVFGLYAVLVVYRISAIAKGKQAQRAVASIHAQKITLDVVMGKYLPVQPDAEKNSVWVAGIDTNKNGIRDDVELALFKKYPDSIQIRAAELQYALTEQMFLTRVNDVDTWKAVSEENARAQLCLIDSHATRNEVEDLVFNTEARRRVRNNAYDFITSYGPEPGRPCDISIQ